MVSDDHFLIPNETLGQAYRRCAHVSRPQGRPGWAVLLAMLCPSMQNMAAALS